MNGKERVGLTMRHRAPDRVPVMCQLSFGHYRLNTGISPHELWYTSEAIAEAMVMLQRRYQFDGILVNSPGRPPDILKNTVSIDRDTMGEIVHWKDGSQTIMPWDDMPHFIPADGTKPQRANFETIDPDHLEEIDKYPGYIWNTYHIQALPEKSTLARWISFQTTSWIL